MATQYTSTLKLALPVTGELSGTWGDVVNDNITSMVEQAVAGLATINTWTANVHTLTVANGLTSESRCAMLVAADGAGGTALTAAGEIICPAASKLYVLKNGTSYAITLKTSGGTGIAVPVGQTAFLFCDGTNVLACVTTVINGVISGNLTVNGNTTLGDANTDTITATARFNTDLLPSTDNARDLGSSGNSWKDVYIDGTAYLALVDINGGAIDGVSIGVTTPATVINVDNLSLNGNTLSSTDTNGSIVIAPNGTGDVQLDADTVRIGDSGATATLTTNGAGNLVLSTNSGATSGTVTIANGANGNIVLAPDGTGDVQLDADTVRVGDVNTDAFLTTNGTGNLNLTTNGGTNSGTIQIAQGVNGAITLTPNGTGVVSVPTIGITGGTANGVGYLNASKVLTTGSALTFDGAILGVNGVSVGRGAGAVATNTAVGASALAANTSGVANTAIGVTALYSNVTGATNTAVGSRAGYFTTGSDNTLIGNDAGRVITTGANNTALGSYVMNASAGVTGSDNIGIGRAVLSLLTSGSNNIAVGNGTMTSTTTGSSNTAVGNLALAGNTTGTNNTIVGARAGATLTTGTYNTFIGSGSNDGSGFTVTTGSKNTILGGYNGNQSGLDIRTASNFIVLSDGDGNPRQYYEGANNAWIWQTAGSEQMRLTSTGLGIGTSSPSVRLETSTARSATLTSAIFAASGTGAVNDFNKLTLKVQNTLGGSTGGAAIGAVLEAAASNKTGLALYYDAGSGAQTEGVRLDASGNLGLGVVPSAWQGSSKAIQLGAYSAVFQDASGYPGLSFNAVQDPSLGWKRNFADVATRYSQTNGQHQWYTAPSGTAGNAISFTQAMTLDASGNLGIGTSSPVDKLVVASPAGGSQTISGNFRSFANLYATQLGSPGFRLGYNESSKNAIMSGVEQGGGTGGGVEIWTYNGSAWGERMRLDSSGNLGLGVTPSAWTGTALQVGSTSALYQPAAQYTNIASNFYEGTDGIGRYLTNGFATLYSANRGASIYAWYTAPSGTAGNAITFTQAMTLDASGALLVGTTTPAIGNTGGFSFTPGVGTFNGVATIGHSTSNVSGSGFINFNYNGSAIGSISQNGTTAVDYNTSSDYRLKNITGPVTTSGAYIDSLNPVEGTWKADGSTFVGLLAHEVQEASRTNVATGVKDGEQMQAMDYSNSELIANLIAEVKSLRARVAALEAK